MHKNTHNLQGQRFGMILVMEPCEERCSTGMKWNCLCDCGTQFATSAFRLKRGHTKSCGCLKKRTGESHPHYRGGYTATRHRKRVKRFGLTTEEYDNILGQQNGKCAICLTDSPGAKSWCIDHCHTTGNVRGLLCNKCNMAVGLLQDDVFVLQRAIEYLQK